MKKVIFFFNNIKDIINTINGESSKIIKQFEEMKSECKELGELKHKLEKEK